MRKDTLTIEELLIEAKIEMSLFHSFIIEKDKFICKLKVFMENDSIFAELMHNDPVKFEKLLETDPFFKRLFEQDTLSNRLYFKKSEEEKKRLINEHYLNLFTIIVASISLSYVIDILTLGCLKIINSPKLRIDISPDNAWEKSTIKQLKYLRFADIISEIDYNNIYILYKIRNRFAHTTLHNLDTKDTLDLLQNIIIDDENIKNSPNNVDKFVMIEEYYKALMWEKIKKYIENRILKNQDNSG